MTEIIFRNAMKTPDGTVIESLHRHDYVVHLDKNGEEYMVDGGTSYYRRSVNKVPAEDLSVESIDGDHEHNRQHFQWGTYGKDGKMKFKLVILKDMELDHIEAILESQHLAVQIKDLFQEEIKYRGEEK